MSLVVQPYGGCVVVRRRSIETENPMKFLPVCEPLLAGNELAYVTKAVESGWISSAGQYVGEFEKTFAEYCNVSHGISAINGTAALHLALLALGVGPGDEVIIPDFTMIASATAVCYTGATPVFVDADARTWNLSVDAVRSKVTRATKAIMAVHIFGSPCDMEGLRDVADSAGASLIEDCAEAHGAEVNGVKVGRFGRIAAFSFFANKNLSTGEGGMVVTDDPELADKCRYYKNMCFALNGPRNYLHEDIGYNYRMSNLHAALGLAQTERADDYRALRIANGMRYRKNLSLVPGISLQELSPANRCVFWMNGILINPEYGRTRDELVAELRENRVETRLFFNGMHRQPALKKYGCSCEGAYPVSDYLADHGFYLPSGSGLAPFDIDRVCEIIADYART